MGVWAGGREGIIKIGRWRMAGGHQLQYMGATFHPTRVFRFCGNLSRCLTSWYWNYYFPYTHHTCCSCQNPFKSVGDWGQPFGGCKPVRRIGHVG